MDQLAEIEKELMTLSGESSLSLACQKLGLASPTNTLEIVDALPWYRAGAETYMSPFTLCVGKESSFRLAFKACVAAGPPIEQTLAQWVERRHVLSAHGLGTPKFYGANNGVLLEEFLPYACSEQLRGGDRLDIFLGNLGKFYAKVGALGFMPVALLHNLFGHGNDIVNVDFGVDLGAQTEEPTDLLPLFLREVSAVLPHMDKEKILGFYPDTNPIQRIFPLAVKTDSLH